MIRQIFAFDVASQELQGYELAEGWFKVVNDKLGVKAFLKELPKDAIIVLEATGGYGLLLAEMACKMGFTVYMVQPAKVKNFCKSSPNRGKTDKFDAQDIAAYLVAFIDRLHPYTPLPPFEARLRKLYRTKEAITDHIATLRTQLRSLGDSTAEIGKALKGLSDRVGKIDKQIAAMLEQAKDAEVLFGIPAVKANMVAAVLPALRTIPFKSKYALDSYAGVDPKPNESGKFKGRRRLSHEGDPHLRRAIYMAGLSATRCKEWRDYYQALKAEKKLAPVEAINVMGRKILHTIYGVYRSQTKFQSSTT